MAELAEMTLKIKDISECPICTELYSEPKILPCIHTFCLKCLEGWSKDKKPGEQVSCPLCRKEFIFPEGGMNNLPNNFFLAKLLEVKLIVTSKEKSFCYYCEFFKHTKEIAKVYCTVCQQYLCNICEDFHKQQKIFKTHNVIAIDSGLRHTDLIKMSVCFCNQHQDEAVKLYCFDCNTTICLVCFADEHNSHKCSSIAKVNEQFSERLRDDVTKVASIMGNVSEKVSKLAEDTLKFTENVKSVEESIIKRGDELKTLIDQSTNSLLLELKTIEKDNMKKMEIAKQELEREMLVVESFIRYGEELKDNGTSCDMARLGEDLHARAIELQRSNLGELKFSFIDVTFKSTNLQTTLTPDKSNLVGIITQRAESHGG